MRHTPGPWSAGHCIPPSRAWSINHTNRIVVAGVSGGALNDKSDEEVEANARLIAATPDLLEALRLYVQIDIECGTTDDDLHQTAIAAITKAQNGVDVVRISKSIRPSILGLLP